MEGFELCLEIDERFQAHVSESWVRDVVIETLASQGVSVPLEMGVVITDDEGIRKLNNTYRGIDDATDVLSFALLEDGAGPFVSPPDGVLHLGDVIISYPRAVEQASEHDHPVQRELALLLVHGVLHLLGHEHEEPEDESRMRAEEERVLEALTL